MITGLPYWRKLQLANSAPSLAGLLFGALVIKSGADMEIGTAAASLLIGWLTYWFLLKRMTSRSPLPVRIAVLKVLPLLFGLMLVPAPDQRDDPDNPNALTLHDRQEA